MSAEAQIKSFVDRVLRLKEEQDTIGQDIRDVYAEAKSLGFDKTQLGNVVSHVRKVEKKGRDAINEGNAIFDMYLAAYEGTGTASGLAHTRARAEDFQPPRTASLSEMKDAYKNGNPISQDFRFEGGSVYFLAFKGLGRVKIGVSQNVEQRIADLQKTVGDEAEVLAIIPGNRQAEIAAHKHHAGWQLAGEWYRLCDEILKEIESYTRAHTHEAEPHDPETGEILESVQSHEALGPSAPAESASGEISATNQEPSGAKDGVLPSSDPHEADESGSPIHEPDATTSRPEPAVNPAGHIDTPATGQASAQTDGDAIGGVKVQGRLPDAAGVEPSPSEPIRKSSLKPLCRYPGEDRCAGYGSVTCHACLRAAREDEVAA